MSLYEETRARLDDALTQLQLCRNQRPLPDPAVLHRAQTMVEQQTQELRRAALVALAARTTVRKEKLGHASGADGVSPSGAVAQRAPTKSKVKTTATTTANSATTALPDIRSHPAASAAAVVNADTRRGAGGAARDGELFRRGDLLHKGAQGTAAGASTATFASAGRKAASPSPQSRTSAAAGRKVKPSSSMPLPSRLGTTPSPRLKSSAVGEPRALTPTPPTAARPSSSSSAAAVASRMTTDAATASFPPPLMSSGATGDAGDSAASALVALESTLTFDTDCLEKAAQSIEKGLHDEADAIFLKAIAADVERLRVVADTIVSAPALTARGTAAAAGGGSSEPAARGHRRSPSAHAARQDTSRSASGQRSSETARSPLPALSGAEDGEQSWRNAFDEQSSGAGVAGGLGPNFIVEVGDKSGVRSDAEAYNGGIKGRHVPLRELPLALRAYYVVMQYDMLTLVSAFSRLLRHDAYADSGAAVLLHGVAYVEKLVQCVCDLATAPPLRAGRDELRPQQASKPPLTRIGSYPVKALLAVREAFNDQELRQLLGARVSFSEEDVQSVRIDYKVGECGYHLVFTGTVYIYEMVQCLLRRAQALQQQCDHASGAGEQGSAAGLEAAAVASASISHTAANEAQWIDSMVSALTTMPCDERRGSDDDHDARSGVSSMAATSQGHSHREAEPALSVQLERVQVACTVALAQCIDVCEGQSPLLFKLATTKYLGWRVKLYESLAQVYAQRGDYTEALSIVRRMSRKTKELVALEFYDQVPPPAEWQVTLETALQRGALEEMRYTWYAFIAGQHAFEAECDASRRAAALSSSSSAAAAAAASSMNAQNGDATSAGGGGAGAEGGAHDRSRVSSRMSSSDARHRAGPNASVSGGAGGSSRDGCAVVVSESGTIVSADSLPRSGVALLGEIWSSLLRHPLPRPGSKNALEDDAAATAKAANAKNTDGTSPIKAPSTTKSRRKSSLGRRASLMSASPSGTTALSQPTQEYHRKEALARQQAQTQRACQRQFATQALAFLSGFLVKQNARVEATERDVAHLFASGTTHANASQRGKTTRAASPLGQRSPAGAAESARRGNESAPPVVSFASLRRCAREALEIVFHCLSAQAVSLVDPALRGALLGCASDGAHLFPFPMTDTFTLEAENAALVENVGAQLVLAMEKSKDEKRQREAEAAAVSAGVGGHGGAGAGKGTKKGKPKNAVTGGKQTGTAAVGGGAGGVHSESTSAASGAAASGDAHGSGETLIASPVFVTSLSVSCLFPQLSRLAKWDPLACEEQLRAAAAAVESSGDDGCVDAPSLQLPAGKAFTATEQSALRLDDESPLEAEVVLMLRLYTTLFSTPCHAVYLRTGAVLQCLLRACRSGLEKRRTGTTTRNEAASAAAPPTTHYLLEAAETTVRVLQHLHLSLLVSRFAAESCCVVQDVILSGRADLRLVGLPRWLASRHESEATVWQAADPASKEAVVEAAQHVVVGPFALLSGLLLSVKALVSAQVEHAAAQRSLFHPNPSAAPSVSSTTGVAASAEARVFRLCTPLLAPAELLRQLACAVAGGATTATWPSAPILASTVGTSYACANLFEQTLFVTADLILHEATTAIAARREDRQYRAQLGLTSTPFHDPTPAFLRAPAVTPQSPSPLRTEEDVDEEQEKTYFQIVIRTVEALAATGTVDPVRLGELTHSLADAALVDMEAMQRSTVQPEASDVTGERGAQLLTTLQQQQKTSRGKSSRTVKDTTSTLIADIDLPVYSRERRLQDLLDRARLAHAFVAIAMQLVAQRADALQQVLSSPAPSGPALAHRLRLVGASTTVHLARLRHALEDTNTDLTRTATQLRWYIGLLRSQTAAYTQRQDDIRTLLARQLHSDVYGVVTAKETRILTALLEEEPELPQSAEAEEARLISAAYRDPLKNATVMLALATVVPKPLCAQRELLGKAIDVLLKLENSSPVRSASPGDRTAGGGGSSAVGAPTDRVKRKAKKEGREPPVVAKALFSRLMVWAFAASVSAKLGATRLARTARKVLYRYYVLNAPEEDASEDTTTAGLPRSQRPVEEELHSYRLEPRLEALQSGSEGALATLCQALLDLSTMELTAVREEQPSASTSAARRENQHLRTRDVQRVGLRCAYRLMFALQLLAMRQSSRSSKQTASPTPIDTPDGASTGAAKVSGRASKPAGAASGKGKGDPAATNAPSSPSLSGSSGTVDAPTVSLLTTDPLTLHCANELLNALFLLLEDDAPCVHVIPPLVALCQVILGIRSALVWCAVDVQLFAIRVLKGLRDTLDRLASQPQPSRGDDEGGAKREDLTFLLHRTFVHAWNAVYANPNVRQKRFLRAVSAESVYARYVLNTKDGVPPPPPNTSSSSDVSGLAHRGHQHGANRDDEDGAAAMNSSVTGETNGEADGVFTFMGSQYAPAPETSFIYDRMPIEYLELLEQLLLSQCTPEAVQDLLHPRPTPAPPRLPPLPQPASATSRYGDSAPAAAAASVANHNPSLSRSSLTGGKKNGSGGVRRTSSHSASGQRRRGRGLSSGSTVSVTDEEAAAAAALQALQQRQHDAAERESLKTQLRERLRIQSAYTIACQLGDAPLQGLPAILIQLAETLARDAALVSAAAPTVTTATATSSPSLSLANGTILDVLERFSQDPLQARLSIGAVQFYLCRGDIATARAVASAALSGAAEQWAGMKRFVGGVQDGLKRWQMQHGFILSERPQYGTEGEGSDADDENEEQDGGGPDGGERAQPGGAAVGGRRAKGDNAKGKNKAKAGSNAKKKNSTHGKHRGGAAAAVSDEADKDDGPDPRFLDVPRVWSSAEQLMLKQVTRSLTWLRRRRVFTWLTRRFFQFNGPAQAQLRVYMGALLRLEKDRSEVLQGTGGALVSLIGSINAATATSAAVTAEKSAGPDRGRSMLASPAAATVASTGTAKGKRAQQQQAENEAAMAQRAREERDQLELLLSEHCLRAAKLFNQAFLPARSVRAVVFVVDHLRQNVCAELPDGFLLSQADPFMETDMAGSGAARRRSNGFEDDQMTETSFSVWGDSGAQTGGGLGSAAASIDVARVLPASTVEKLRQLAPCLVELAKELLCAMATVALGYCDHRHDLELSQPSAIKTGPYVRLQNQIRFQGIIPSLLVCTSPAGQFEERRHTLLAQLAHTRHERQLMRRLQECSELEQSTRAIVVETWKTELLAKLETNAQTLADTGRDDLAALWSQFANTARTCGAAMDDFDLLSPGARTRRNQQQAQLAQRGPARLFTLDTAAITTGAGGGDGASAISAEGEAAGGTAGASRRRAGPPTSTLVYFPFETPLLRRQLWNDTSAAPHGADAASPSQEGAASQAVYTLRLGPDMPEELLVEYMLYLVRAVQLTHQKEAVQLCLAANALTSGRYAATLLSLAMTVQAAIGMPSTAELLRAYRLARAEVPVGVGLLEVARRAWQRYHYTDTFARARQRLARSLLPSLKHFEDPSLPLPSTTTRTANALTTGMSPSLFLHDQNRFGDARGGSVSGGGGGGVGMSSLKVSLKVVLAQYEVALSALRKKRDFGLAGECLSEMAEIYLWHRSRTEAENCWRDAVDSLLETPRSLQTWRTSPCDGSRLTLTRVLLAVSALSSLAMFAFRDQQRKAVEACVLAASLVDRLLTEAGISLMLPERAFDYAAHGITSLHNALRYLDLPLRQHQQIQHTVHKLLYVAHTLLEFDYPIHASMVASFAEYLANRFAKHWVMVVESRLVRARAAAKSGHFTAAFNALRSVCLGESFPDITVALAPLAPPTDSLVTGHHFIQLAHGGSGGAAGTSDGKKGARQSSSANNGGGGGAGLGATATGSTTGLAASGLVGPAASAPGPADGHAHLSVLETLAGLQYRNDEMPSSAANVDFVSWFVAACLPNFANLLAATAPAPSAAATTPASTSAGATANGSSAVAVPNPAQCLDVKMADVMGPLLAPRVVMAVAEVLVTLGSREGAYQWGEGVVGDVAAATASATAATAGRPSSGRSNGVAGGARSGSRQRLSVAGGSTTSVIAAAATVSAAAAHGSTAAGGTSTGAPSAVLVESGPAVALQHATACTVALQVAEPLLDWLRHEQIRLSALQVASGGGQSDVSAASRGGLTRTLSTSSGLSGRETASPPLTSAGIGAEGESQSAAQRLSQIIQQQRVEQAAMLRHHATYLRAVALAARGRLRQSVALLEAHLIEFNEFALPSGAAADTEVAAVAETDIAAKGRGGPSSSSSSTARGSSVVRQQNSKNTRAGAASDVAFHLLGKGFSVSSVVGTPSFLLTVSHTHWCRVYALLTANCFGLRRFQAMEAATRHALSLCEQCDDPYSSRLFLLYRCAALAQRGQLEDAAETARQLHRTTAALSFSPNGFVAAAAASGAGIGQEQLAERVSALAVPCAHGVAAADVWDACTLLVQNWMQRALTQHAEQQRHLGPNAAAGIAEGSSSGGGGGGHGSNARTETLCRKRKTAKSQAQSDSEDVATSQSDCDEALQGGCTGGGLALSRAVCALAANAFFQGVAPWVQQEKAAHDQGRSRRSGPTNKHAAHCSTSSSARWVISPYGAPVAWNSASLTQLHRAMNVYAASFLTPAAPRTEIDRSICVLSQALEGVAPQYDARAHPTNSVTTKLLLARAWLHGMDWENLVYPASSSRTPARPPTTDVPGLASAPSAAGRGRKPSLRPLSASSTSAAALTPEGSGTWRRGCGLLFYTPSDAIAALPWPRESTHASAFTAAPPVRGLLQRAARLLFEAVHDSVSAAVHDYGVMQVALLELASIFARVGETAERAEWLMDKTSSTTAAAHNSTTSPARPVQPVSLTVVDDASNSESHVKSNAQSRCAAGAADQTRVETARNLRQLAKACAPVAASCTILAMLLNAMQANVFDHTRAFSDYATDEANMVMSLTALEKVLPERVVVAVEAAARQLGTLSEDCSGGGGGDDRSGSSAAGAGVGTLVDSFYHAFNTDGTAGRARGGGDGAVSSRRTVSSTGASGPTATTAAAPSDGVPLSNLVHAFATLHREQGLTTLMPAPEALDRESALVVLRALLQTKTAPPSCVYLCYDEATRRANAMALASGGITTVPHSSGAVGFNAGGGGSAGSTRRVGGAANAATAAALQQQQETSDMWYAMLPPVLLSGSVGGYLTSAGPQLLGAPGINSVIAACLQTATGADPLRPRALTEGYESHAAKGWATLLLSLSPWHDATLVQAPPLSTPADRKRLLRGYPTCLQTAAGSDTASQSGTGRSGRAGSAHSTDGFNARRRASSRQSAQSSAGRVGQARATPGGASSGAEAASAGDGRVRPLVMDALLAERIEALEAEEDATLSRESPSLPCGAAMEPRDADESEPTARRTWSCLTLELPLEVVRQLHEHARRALQLHAQLVECQRRLANVTAGRHAAATTEDSVNTVGVGLGFSPGTASLGAGRRASVSRGGAATPGTGGGNSSPLTQNTVVVPSQPGPLASGPTQLQAALLDATNVLKSKVARQVNGSGGTGVGLGGTGGASGSAGISGGGAAAGTSAITPSTAMGNAARHGTRRGLSSQSAPSSEGSAGASGHGSLACAQGGADGAVLDARVHDLAHAAEKQREAALQDKLASVSDALDEVKSAFMMGFIEAVVRTYVTRALADEALLDACVQQLLPECAMTPALFTFFEKWFSAASQISAITGGASGAEARTSTASSFFDPGLHAWMKRVVVSVTQWRQENVQRA